MQLDINDSNWNIKPRLDQIKMNMVNVNENSGHNSARNGNLTPRMNIFDMSVNYTSETTGF